MWDPHICLQPVINKRDNYHFDIYRTSMEINLLGIPISHRRWTGLTLPKHIFGFLGFGMPKQIAFLIPTVILLKFVSLNNYFFMHSDAFKEMKISYQSFWCSDFLWSSPEIITFRRICFFFFEPIWRVFHGKWFIELARIPEKNDFDYCLYARTIGDQSYPHGDS